MGLFPAGRGSLSPLPEETPCASAPRWCSCSPLPRRRPGPDRGPPPEAAAADHRGSPDSGRAGPGRVQAGRVHAGGRGARDTADRVLARSLSHRAQDVHARQRAAAHRPRGSLGAGRRREPLVPRRLAQRAARQDRLRAPVRALLLQRQRALPERLPRGDGRPRRQQPQRHDQQRSHQLLRERAGVGARADAVPRSRSHGLPRPAHHQGEPGARARRRAEREAAGREPALREGVRARSARRSIRRRIRTAGRRSAAWRISTPRRSTT